MDANTIGYMQHALALARKGIALASPNPMVGCVLVREGQIVGEGFHQYEWRDHAEVVAIKSAGEKSEGATMYVTLEPCSHTGRTGPCTEAIIKAGIQRVVSTIQDPNPTVGGRGFERLRAAGLEVFTGVMEEESWLLNEAFAKWIRKKTPLVTLKSAMTLDGQLALPEPRASAKRFDVDYLAGIARGSASHAACIGCVAYGNRYGTGRRSVADGSQWIAATTAAAARNSGFKITIAAESTHRKNCGR